MRTYSVKFAFKKTRLVDSLNIFSTVADLYQVQLISESGLFFATNTTNIEFYNFNDFVKFAISNENLKIIEVLKVNYDDDNSSRMMFKVCY